MLGSLSKIPAMHVTFTARNLITSISGALLLNCLCARESFHSDSTIEDSFRLLSSQFRCLHEKFNRVDDYYISVGPIVVPEYIFKRNHNKVFNNTEYFNISPENCEWLIEWILQLITCRIALNDHAFAEVALPVFEREFKNKADFFLVEKLNFYGEDYFKESWLEIAKNEEPIFNFDRFKSVLTTNFFPSTESAFLEILLAKNFHSQFFETHYFDNIRDLKLFDYSLNSKPTPVLVGDFLAMNEGIVTRPEIFDVDTLRVSAIRLLHTSLLHKRVAELELSGSVRYIQERDNAYHRDLALKYLSFWILNHPTGRNILHDAYLKNGDLFLTPETMKGYIISSTNRDYISNLYRSYSPFDFRSSRKPQAWNQILSDLMIDPKFHVKEIIFSRNAKIELNQLLLRYSAHPINRFMFPFKHENQYRIIIFQEVLNYSQITFSDSTANLPKYFNQIPGFWQFAMLHLVESSNTNEKIYLHHKIFNSLVKENQCQQKDAGDPQSNH